MFIFPIIYLSSFLLAIRGVIKGDRQEGLLFLIFGLSIYTTTQSVLFDLGLQKLISVFQPFKELIILSIAGVGFFGLKKKLRLHIIDYAVLAYFAYTLLYVIMPLGIYGFSGRLLAFKGTSFFVITYLSGRLISSKYLLFNKYAHYILLVAIFAGGVVLLEFLFGQHLQTLTGYADYNYYIFGQEPTGQYGLSYTFEIETGIKRFGSFFSDPLEHASATVVALAVIAGLYTRDNNQFRLNKFGLIALGATFISIILALSRASFISYFLVIYVYAILTKRKYILHIFHGGFALCIIYFLFLIRNRDLYEFVLSTITFEDSSSIGHLIEWLHGINAMIKSPLGLGLGSSGRVSAATGDHVGGENTFIVIGVQVGVIAMGIYMFIQGALLYYPAKWIKHLKGKERKIAITLFLLKLGSVISLLTTNLEAHGYVNFLGWMLSGLFVNVISRKVGVRKADSL